ncbi:phosphoribosyL-amp cyclohydrolase phosphoribosyL-ATP pyrophosphatase [Melioribacter roseus P3M-2]|uniref:Histidine biosynthesis bifunctional protein HisIE n=1 Tax=Melioribacter roseus (strain DSM 23840 / JCM 17771 / VKM B-2668 / P3M-2) TaxID=1191523 RepID=I7A483_MELRP|nr:bifunctional phosphoribosyl-AMP cyclohydrolase/phosphoribosyl-ATP diphosphatase HisIE [Melioribacter roseus]AFN76018.1 phosphoribosyL-amp cyclohydrolase phosphoribosyL-ATP pyrophosphatase [Melioribacter roseus P3M-2]
MINIDNIIFEKSGGLVPAIIQDKFTGQVLMLGYMNKEALTKTIDTGLVTFYSRSRNQLWTKGETSGNYLKLDSITTDCDNDTLLVTAVPEGPTCHMNRYSCFGIDKENVKFLSYLYDLIKERKKNLPENSYTTKLFRSGIDRIIQKVGEESIETVIAAKNKDKKEFIDESSDLIYHLFVLMAELDIGLDEIVNNLIQRHTKK